MVIIASPIISASVIISPKRMALTKIEDGGMTIVQIRRLSAPVLSKKFKIEKISNHRTEYGKCQRILNDQKIQ